MSNLRYVDQAKFEKLFDMKSGYVLNFSNASFQAFVAGSVGVDIYNGEYDYGSCSKANMLRGFIKKATNYRVGKLLIDLLEYYVSEFEIKDQFELNFVNELKKIAQGLLKDTQVDNLDALTLIENDADFSRISEIIKSHIEKNEPEVALDRLHTYMIKFSKKLCDLHNIEYEKDEVLNSLFGKYVRWLRENDTIDSRVTFKILGCSIQILEKFNNVRNDQSLAHDNPLLNYQESLLIFNNICNLVGFINHIEESIQNEEVQVFEISDDDVPF